MWKAAREQWKRAGDRVKIPAANEDDDLKNRGLVVTASATAALVAGYIVSTRSKKKKEWISGENGTFPLRPGVPEDDPQTILGCDQEHGIDRERKVCVLITGAGSYIGESFHNYALDHYKDNFGTIDTLDMIDGSWRSHPFTTYDGVGGVERPYDCVFHVAGIAHADVGHTSLEDQERYYKVNTDLAIEVCRKAKEAGCSQFVFMSSMIVYGEAERIDCHTKPHPANFYGDSKWQADRGVREFQSNTFHVAVLRPPMIYGKGSKGNYPTLAKIAKKVPIFPNYQNKRSMLYIENLCEFLCQVMVRGLCGVFFPQNAEYVNTSDLVKEISSVAAHRVITIRFLNPVVDVLKRVPIRKIRDLLSKAFGDSWYEQSLSNYNFNYQVVNLKESIKRTEG